MANMSNSEFEREKKFVQDTYRYGNGTKDSYISYLKRIISSYDDGYECAKLLDAYNGKWTVFGKEL